MALTDGLLHAFEFEEGSGNRVDLITGVPAMPAGVDTVSPTPGKIGNALATDQTGAGLHGVQTPLGDVRTGTYWGRTAVSFAFWIQRFSGFAGTDTILNSFYGDPGGISQNLNIRFNNTLNGNVRTQDGVDPAIAGNIALPVNTWVHVVWTYDQDTVWQYYLDGVPGESTPASGRLLSVINQADVRYRFAYTDAPTPSVVSPIAQLHGLLDQFLIYGRALSAAEIQTLVNNGDGIIIIADALDLEQTFQVRELILQNFLGVQVKVLGTNQFEVYDKRIDSEAALNSRTHQSIGPLIGNYQSVRLFLDPTGSVLPTSL